MTKVGDRWRLAMGPLDGFYYYRYVVDGVDKVPPAAVRQVWPEG